MQKLLVLVTKLDRKYPLNKRPYIEYRLSVVKEKTDGFEEIGFKEAKSEMSFLEKVDGLVAQHPEIKFPNVSNGQRFSRSKEEPVNSDPVNNALEQELNLVLKQ